MRYRLERRDGITELPAWALVAGRAFHETIREWETAAAGDVVPSADAAAERFPHHLAEETAETVIKTGIGPHEWRASGRVSQAYPDKENRAWWLDKGPEMVAQYVLAQAGRESETLRLVDGTTLALELGFMLHLPGLAPLKGFIDQVLYFPRTDQIIVRDYKSGSQVPVDRLQLQMYRLALEDCFGITARAWWGDYWDARKGKATRGYNLTDRSRVEAAVRYRVSVMDTAERQGLYLPNPGNNCSACGVRSHCPAMSDEPHATWRRPSVALDAPTSSN
jgi:CRISPR/Cas system-associated exonuclease Cas4 (RecB family)